MFICRVTMSARAYGGNFKNHHVKILNQTIYTVAYLRGVGF